MSARSPAAAPSASRNPSFEDGPITCGLCKGEFTAQWPTAGQRRSYDGCLGANFMANCFLSGQWCPAAALPDPGRPRGGPAPGPPRSRAGLPLGERA